MTDVDPRQLALQDQLDAAARDTSATMRESAGGYTENVDMDVLLASPFGAVAAFVLNTWFRHGNRTCAHITGPLPGATLLPLCSPPVLLCTECTWATLGWIHHESPFAGTCDACGTVDDSRQLSHRFVQFGHVVILFGLCERCAIVVSPPEAI